MKKFVFITMASLLATASLHSQDARSNSSIWLPAQPWALELQAPGFSIDKNVIQPDGRRYFLAENKTTKVTASVYLEAMPGDPAPGECQRSLHDKEKRFAPLSSNGLQDVVYSERDGMEILEYLLPEVKDAPIKQHNLFACRIRGNVFIDIHISKPLFTPADQSVSIGRSHRSDSWKKLPTPCPRQSPSRRPKRLPRGIACNYSAKAASTSCLSSTRSPSRPINTRWTLRRWLRRWKRNSGTY